MIAVGLVFSNRAKQIETKIQSLADEFSVGHPSREFIAKARSIGASNYLVTSDIAPIKERVPDDRPPFEPEWSADTMETGRKWVQIEKLDAIESQFKKLSEGSASVLMTMPPFERKGCEIRFKDGKVTVVRVYDLH